MQHSLAMTTTLTGRNQITIPAALAARFGLKAGARIEWIVGDAPDEFRCRVLPDTAMLARELRGAGRKYLKPGSKHPLTALLEERVSDDTIREAAL
jgi:bifunctional DNA-binding transcriptional regulator/antitoxin component of YhaV-PrlF toxin-antitoxin module